MTFEPASPHCGPPPAPPLTVVSILGWGRSGSTLLARILGESPGVFAAGELRWIAGPGVPCGCGAAVSDCTFWRAVIERTVAGTGITLGDFADAQAATLLPRRTLALLYRPGKPPRALVETFTARLLEEIASATGCHTIIESSKDPATGALLSRLPGFATRGLLLVRDPRASSWSWSGRTRPGLHQLHPGKAAVRWLEWTLFGELVSRRMGAGRRIRYEDLVADPEASLQTVRALAGIDSRPAGASADIVELGHNHVVGGNPNRTTRGSIQIRPDEEWRQKISTRDALLTTLITAAGLLRHGYPLRWRAGRKAR